MRTIFFVTCYTSILASAAAEPPVVPDAALSGWRQVREAASSGLRGNYRFTQIVTVDDEQREPIAYNVGFAVSAEGMVYKLSIEGNSRITVWNPEYAFEATTVGDEQPVVSGAVRRGAVLREMQTQIRDSWQRLPLGGFAIAGKSMSDLVSDRRFKVISIQQDDHEKIATMIFESSEISDDRPRDTALTGGTVHFATDKHWAIESYDCSTVWGRIDAKIRYRPFEGTFIPEFREEGLVGHGGKSVVRETYELEDIYRVASGEHLPVLLADYGLSEPTAKLTEGSSRTWQLALLNIVLLIAVFGTYFYIRRRQLAGPKEA